MASIVPLLPPGAHECLEYYLKTLRRSGGQRRSADDVWLGRNDGSYSLLHPGGAESKQQPKTKVKLEGYPT